MEDKITSIIQWTEILSSIGIPSPESEEYASVFVKSRLSRNDLADLDKETLRGLNVTTLGDQLKILRLGKSGNNDNTAQAGKTADSRQSYKCPSASASVKLPEITTKMTHPSFRKARVDWDVYKTITSIPDHDMIAHLYSACEASLQSSIINAKPDFLQLNEKDALDYIERLVTKLANPTVHRKEFHSIKQNNNEAIQEFIKSY